jgi:hypothetical protein
MIGLVIERGEEVPVFVELARPRDFEKNLAAVERGDGGGEGAKFG